MLFRQYSKQMMLINKYLSVVFGLVVFDSIFLTFTYSALLDSSLTPLILGARILVDVIFLTITWKNIKLTKAEGVLILMILLSFFFATLPNAQYSSSYSINRFLNDISGPLLFILKVSVLRSLFCQKIDLIDIKNLSRALIYLSALQIIIFIYFSRNSGAYAGIALPINIPAALYISTFNYFGLAVTVVLVAFSGKRSFLVSLVIVTAFIIAMRGRVRYKFAFLITLACLLITFSLFGNEKIDSTVTAINDFLDIAEISRIDFNSDQARSGLYLITSGRSEEFYAILREMKPWSWLVGLGPGFTYSYLHSDGLVEGYANSHFSPLSLTYKFGILYALLFYAYLSNTILTLLKTSHAHSLIVGCVLSLFLLQSFFAFNLHAEPYFPIFLAFGMAIVSTNKKTRFGGNVKGIGRNLRL
jgi:hypothetical protein